MRDPARAAPRMEATAMFTSRSIRIPSALLLSATLAACTGRATSSGGPPAAGQTVIVTVVPAEAEMGPGETLQFSAIVTGTANAAVTWRVEGAGTIDANGLYTAPLTAGDFVVVAETGGTAGKIQGRGRVKVKTQGTNVAVAVTIAPSSGAVDACRSLTFLATVTGATDASVSWTVQEGTAGGSVTASGVYTAPSTAGTYHVVATSRADPAKSAVVPVVVTERIVSIEVTPALVQLTAGGTSQFTATVTTTCGAFTQQQTISPP